MHMDRRLLIVIIRKLADKYSKETEVIVCRCGLPWVASIF